MNEAKVQLSPEELALVGNADWILTKNAIIGKVTGLFGWVASASEPFIRSAELPEVIKNAPPKISKGENYQGLPYVVLDYPRLFQKHEIFAIRTLFWWAHYFSVTLHVKGQFRDLFEDRIRRHAAMLAENGFYLSVSGDEWVHELGGEHYLPMREGGKDLMDEAFRRHPFIKISAKTEFAHWEQAGQLLTDRIRIILSALKGS
jgi:hypothetical protein